jgi:hypothetical protein
MTEFTFWSVAIMMALFAIIANQRGEQVTVTSMALDLMNEFSCPNETMTAFSETERGAVDANAIGYYTGYKPTGETTNFNRNFSWIFLEQTSPLNANISDEYESFLIPLNHSRWGDTADPVYHSDKVVIDYNNGVVVYHRRCN